MLFRPSKDYTFVVYQDEHSPRCFTIKKSHLKFLTISLPVITGLALIFIIFGSAYFKTIEEAKKQQIPALVNELKTKLNDLESQNKELKDIETELLSKLSSTQAPSTAILPTFSIVPGMKDLTGRKMISLESVHTKVDKEEVEFRFTVIKSNYDGQKVSGHIFVSQKHLANRHIYPTPKVQSEQGPINFNQGEYFSIRRGRPPTAINFPRPKTPQGDLFFEVVIFSRTGDLLLKEKYGPIPNKVN